MGKIEIKMLNWKGTMPQADLSNFLLEDGSAFFTTTLFSDTILVDRLLRPVITLTPQILYDIHQVGFPEHIAVSVEKAFCATRRVSGWHTVAQIFKPDDIAITKGSTFLLKVSEADRNAVQEWMQKALYTGIGLRRSEGFGQVRFDEPLHETARMKGGQL